LTFHNYSELLRDSNGSLIVYDGADGASATGSATKADLTAQITGTSMGYSYYSAVTMWAVKLPMDLHVKGTVSFHVYISSTYTLGGLFNGGGYAMGIVDIDENNNEVKEFLSSATYSLGNPFTSTPAQYSQTVNVDYTFRSGHTLAFVVGLGATVQGYVASVYFGSTDRASGATLPVAQNTQTQTVQSDAGPITAASDATIQNLQYDGISHALSYNVKGIDYTPCSGAVTIPKALLQAPFTVTQGTKTIQATTSQNDTYYQITYTNTITDEVLKVAGLADVTASPTPTPTVPTSDTSSPTQQSESNSPFPSSSVDVSSSSPQVPEGGVYVLGILVVVACAALTARVVKRRR
jgi:hypothetical protein